jgi:FMN phosphatase YigB (HAD superfamily)
MSIQCIVLDFDGTFSDVEAEAAPFLPLYRRDVFDLLGRSAAAAWEREEERIRAEPGRFGWEYRGTIVAPANADPFLRSTVVAQNLCELFGVLENRELRSELLDAIYRRNYVHTQPVLRPEARTVIEGLVALGLPIYVVTNAATAAVQKKLRLSAPEAAERLTVIGDARKFEVREPRSADARFDGLPSELEVPGLRRGVQLRRGAYFEAFARIWEETGAAPAETLVCGDIFELDLAMPLALGAHVHLVTRPDTPEYEQAFLRSQAPRGGVSGDLGALLQRVRG